VPLGNEPTAALRGLADDAAAASYSELPPADDAVRRAAAAAQSVEVAIRSTATPRQRLLWTIDPRPLFSRRRA
jgi:hypothetical protein